MPLPQIANRAQKEKFQPPGGHPKRGPDGVRGLTQALQYGASQCLIRCWGAGRARAVWGGAGVHRPDLWGGHHCDSRGGYPAGGVGPGPGGVLHQERHAHEW